MLLRSASTPSLKSCIRAATTKETSLEVVASSAPKIPRVRSAKTLSSLTSTAFSSRKSSSSTKKPKVRGAISPAFSITLEEKNIMDVSEEEKLTSCLSFSDDSYSRAHANTLVADKEGCLDDGGCNMNGSGGNTCGSGGNTGGASDPSNTDAYYQNMIKADPANSMVLGNYARFLKEVQGDTVKAQEYCERGIVADQKDSGTLSMYAEIIWESGKDAERAETYFDRAIQAAPDDCYVMASYARFLWEADEEEEEEEEKQGKTDVTKSVNWSYPIAGHPSVAAAS